MLKQLIAQEDLIVHSSEYQTPLFLDLNYSEVCFLFRYDMCRRRKGGRCTKGTAGMCNDTNINEAYVHTAQCIKSFSHYLQENSRW